MKHSRPVRDVPSWFLVAMIALFFLTWFCGFYYGHMSVQCQEPWPVFVQYHGMFHRTRKIPLQEQLKWELLNAKTGEEKENTY